MTRPTPDADVAEPFPGSAAWWLRRAQPAPEQRTGRPPGITQRQILDAALVVIEAEGPTAMTMRRVAEELGTGAASLYRHIRSREELVVLLIEDVMSQLGSAASEPLCWRDRMEEGARRLRDHLLRHKAVIPLITSAQMLGPSTMRGREATTRNLILHGFDPVTAMRMQLAVHHFVVSSAQLEIRRGARTSTERDELRALFESLDSEVYPTVVANAAIWAAHDSQDEFIFGLDALLTGFEKFQGPPPA